MAPLHTGSNGSLKEGESSSGAKRRPTVVAADLPETPMSVGSAAAEPYVPTPASTVRSTGKENETSWANSRPNYWLSDHRNPMYGQVMPTCTQGFKCLAYKVLTKPSPA